jgi:hypothetical protein
VNDSFNGRYILDGKTPVPCQDLITWAQWYENDNNRRVAFNRIAPGIEISTIFLGLDDNYSGRGAPILFETMIFAAEIEGWHLSRRRYATWEEAERGHQEMLFELEMALTLI